MPTAFVLFSQPLTDQQHTELRADWHCDEFRHLPADLQYLWSQIPAGSDFPADVVEGIIYWLEEHSQIQDVVLVQGEISTAHAVVQWCIDHQRCAILATTSRQAFEEIQADGSIEMTHRFEHAGFRQYQSYSPRPRFFVWQIQQMETEEIDVGDIMLLTDASHKALIELGDGYLVDLQNICGIDVDGQPLRSNHAHAHHLLLPGTDGAVYLVLWMPDGVSASHSRLCRQFKKLFCTAFRQGLELRAIGPLRTLPPMISKFDNISCHWESLTPYIPTHFLKKSGKYALENRVLCELAQRGFDAPIECKVVPWTQFDLRLRPGSKAPPLATGFAIELKFESPQRGPICLGYGGHFGMGLFQATSPTST